MPPSRSGRRPCAGSIHPNAVAVHTGTTMPTSTASSVRSVKMRIWKNPTILLQPMFMVAVGTIFGLSNALTLISYRQQLRAYNGFINVMAVATVLFLVADVSHALKQTTDIRDVCLNDYSHISCNKFNRL